MASQYFSNFVSSVRSTLSGDNSQAIEEVSNLQRNAQLNQFARNYQLNIQTISWEDTARLKNSSSGPNISDLTLALAAGKNKDCTLLPMIRQPNFADVTADLSIDKFALSVGNERGLSTLTRVSLKDYLVDAKQYLVKSNGSATNDKVGNLYVAARDGHILTSAQFCILPLSNGLCEFNVSLFNYQSTKANPAVLVIVASSQGTSAQVVVDGTTRLYFNRNGQAANFQATRLKDDRQARGKALEGKMDLDEQERNVIFVYQVPLKPKRVEARSQMFDCCLESMNSQLSAQCASYCDDESNEMMLQECSAQFEPQSSTFSKKIKRSNSSRLKRGMDDAMLKAGEGHSEYFGVADYELERDARFPIRCTLQYYKVTDSANIPESTFQEMKEKIHKAMTSGVATGSLVIEGNTGRVTEAIGLPDVTAEQRAKNPLFGLFAAPA